MSHIIELKHVFKDTECLKQALDELGVECDLDVDLTVTRQRGQVYNAGGRRMAIVARCANGETLGFRERELTEQEMESVVDESESKRRSRVGPRGLIPVGDLYYGGIEKTFGVDLYKLKAHYYAKLVKKKLGRRARVSVVEEDDVIRIDATL